MIETLYNQLIQSSFFYTLNLLLTSDPITLLLVVVVLLVATIFLKELRLTRS